MTLASLELRRIEIPFRVAFKHSSADRSETESVWVEARSGSGQRGHGEGCPRDYVTGEDLASVRAFFSRQRDSLLEEVDDIEALRAWMKSRERELDENPAAWCAIELSLLDLFARESDRSVESLLGVPELEGDFRYSAVVGDSDLESFRGLVGQFRAFGFCDFKLKLSGDLERDRAKVEGA